VSRLVGGDGVTVGNRGTAVDGGGRRAPRLHVTAVAMLVVGLIVTAALAAAAWRVHQGNEDRLLEQRTREAAAVLTAASTGVETPLGAAAELMLATDGDAGAFRTFMRPFVGEAGGPFASASLWTVGEAARGPVAVLGDDPVLASRPLEEIQAFFDRPVDGPVLTVLDLVQASPPRLGFSFATNLAERRVHVYAELELPGDRTAVRQPDAAFSDLDYALYIGGTGGEHLVFASTDDLPLGGRTAEEDVTIGDSALRLVVSPTDSLGGTLISLLPLLILVVGAPVATAFALLNNRALRRRDDAERLVDELAEVAEDNARLYEEQRSVAQTLQQSLLPHTLPAVPGLELAARYEAGADEVDVGGDWYDIVQVAEDCVLLVIGDVSGRGVRAAQLTARLRYSIVAYAAQGDDPSTILVKLGSLFSLDADGHFATVLIGSIDLATHTVSIASAGHPNPIVVDRDGARFVDTRVGTPVGVATSPTYELVTVDVAPGDTLLVFTDGLFERRGETIDIGLERLRAAVSSGSGRLEPLLDALIAEFASVSHDDAAILGIRWTAAVRPLDAPAR
jgi:serine phosphatase RsbU (regulator of sigma subunit)